MTRVYYVRHAEAGDRRTWSEPDHLRPLTEAGWLQAEGLANLFDERFSRLLSSPYVRCAQTLEPLAKASALPLELTDTLVEGAPARDALGLLLEVAQDGPAAVCTHGDVLIESLDELHAQGVPLDGPLESAKGSTWVLEVDRGRFLGGRYLEPPSLTRKDA